ncbi:hypothetical protein [Paraburkholderia kirstenboschensis]|uniref:hypothetical protein n=1 Tax=Paraburkholderia kirstenboschensis TaxID=1245436 RepID=UPI001918BA34|nr:hypothetical protein [Paraburkholderia kirstenboschensis]
MSDRKSGFVLAALLHFFCEELLEQGQVRFAVQFAKLGDRFDDCSPFGLWSQCTADVRRAAREFNRVSKACSRGGGA